MMLLQFFLNILAPLIAYFFPEEIDPSQRPADLANCRECRNMEFDFIIVGAGSAGNVFLILLSGWLTTFSLPQINQTELFQLKILNISIITLVRQGIS